MSKKIRDDWGDFRAIIRGDKRKELKKYASTGQILGLRPDGKGRILIPIPQIGQPRIVYGDKTDGVGRGEGNPGDVIEKGKKKGDGKGRKPGDGHSEGMIIGIDVDEALSALAEELQLPNMKPKETATFDEVKIKYNSISRNGPRALLHKQRTLKEAIKRSIAEKNTVKKMVPGCDRPVLIPSLIKDDFRYRQFNEIKIPSSNAVLFFARDGSGSMGDDKCEIVSNMSYWMNLWISRSYKNTERVFVWHDTEAKEVDEKKFYKTRYGGGTNATSSLRFIESQLQYRFKPEKWNIYIFYFGDGETFNDDNKDFSSMLKGKLGSNVVNMVGVTQILSYAYSGSLKGHLDKQISSGKIKNEFLRTASVGGARDDESYMSLSTPEAQFEEMKKAMKDLLAPEALAQ